MLESPRFMDTVNSFKYPNYFLSIFRENQMEGNEYGVVALLGVYDSDPT